MMYYHGDISLIRRGLIAHGVNRQLKMGAGVAKSLYEKHPLVRQCYLESNNPVPNLGCVEFIEVTPQLTIANCYTQDYYGRTGVYADLLSIKTSLDWCCELATKNEQKNIHIPEIGCGLGGLAWDEVGPMVQLIESYYGIEFNVWRLK